MSIVNGRKIICDRCGAEMFCKCTGEGETDGGFTRWNEFETMPDGWGFQVGIGLLCCDCNKQYDCMMDEFMRGVER